MKKNIFILCMILTAFSFYSCATDSDDAAKIPSSPENENPEEENYTSRIFLKQNFENPLDSSVWNLKSSSVISTDEKLADWEQYGNALVNTHGKLLKLPLDSEASIINVNTTSKAVLSFDCRSDVLEYIEDDSCLKIIIDGKEAELKITGYNKMWKRHSVPIASAGDHKIEFKYYANVYSPGLKNAFYIDNVFIIEDKLSKVGLYPSCGQETFAGGHKIQFTAKALRDDGSEITGKTVTWTATGGTIDRNGLFTPGNSSGTFTVTAAIGGIKATNSNIKIYDAGYKSNSVKIGNTTYTGLVSEVENSASITDMGTKMTFESGKGIPSKRSFSANGFFVLKGKVAAGKFGFIKIIKNIGGTDHFTSLIVQDDFYERIWLRFGEGEYKIYLACVDDIPFSNPGNGYRGDQAGGFTYSSYQLLTATNTAKTSCEDSMNTMPSYYCQSDDFRVSNVVKALFNTLPSNATDGQKLQVLHDWLVRRNHYDLESLNRSKRKAQDAVSVIEYGMGVCEGYSNAFIAMMRCAGFKAKYVSSDSMSHGWTEVLYKNAWKMIDATWDDPVSSYDSSNTEKNPEDENYTYFLISQNGVAGDHNSYTYDFENSGYSARSVIAEAKDHPLFKETRLTGCY